MSGWKKFSINVKGRPSSEKSLQPSKGFKRFWPIWQIFADMADFCLPRPVSTELSDSYPAFFLLIATTSNKNF
jgi:hypothetical protein